MRKSSRLGAISVLAVSLLAAGCGGGSSASAGQPAEGGSAASQGAAQAGTGQGPEGMDQLGMQLADALMPELSGIPVPDGAGFTAGTAYTAAQDPRETAVQDAYVDDTVSDVTSFYQQALPDAGFTVTGTDLGAGTTISFVDPDGHEGAIQIAPSAIGPPTQIHVELYRNRTVEASQAEAGGSAPAATVASGTFEVEGTSTELTQGAGDCVISASEVNVAVSFTGGFVTMVGAPSGGWIQVSLENGEYWTGGLSADSPPARFDVNGTSATWAGSMVESASGRTSDGSLTVSC